MSEKLRGCIVGCGGIANWAHKPAYENMDNVEIVAFCDIVVEKAEKMAEEFGVDKKMAFADFKEMLDTVDVDFVDICTPNYLHSIIAVYALGKGINVFCEKPDAVSVDEAEKMQAAAKESGKLLMVMRNNRYNNYSIFLKKYIEEGKMGEIYTARCAWRRRRGIPGKGGWFTTKEQSGGGPLIDLGVHMIDLSIWLMGNPKPVTVSGCTYSKFADGDDVSDSVHSNFGEKVAGGTFDVEDLAMGFIRFDNGASMQIEFSWASNIERESKFIELRGTKAGATTDNATESLKIFTEEFGSTVDITPNLPKTYPGHEANLRHFADVLQNGTEPDFEPIQGVNMIKILEAMYKSAETGHEIAL